MKTAIFKTSVLSASLLTLSPMSSTALAQICDSGQQEVVHEVKCAGGYFQFNENTSLNNRNSKHPPKLAFDGDVNTAWIFRQGPATRDTVGCRLDASTAKGHPINRVEIVGFTRDSRGVQGAHDVRISGTNDAPFDPAFGMVAGMMGIQISDTTMWRTIFQDNRDTPHSLHDPLVIEFRNTKVYNWISLTSTPTYTCDGGGDKDNCVAINEAKFFSVKCEAQATPTPTPEPSPTPEPTPEPTPTPSPTPTPTPAPQTYSLDSTTRATSDVGMTNLSIITATNGASISEDAADTAVVNSSSSDAASAAAMSGMAYPTEGSTSTPPSFSPATGGMNSSGDSSGAFSASSGGLESPVAPAETAAAKGASSREFERDMTASVRSGSGSSGTNNMGFGGGGSASPTAYTPYNYASNDSDRQPASLNTGTPDTVAQQYRDQFLAAGSQPKVMVESRGAEFTAREEFLSQLGVTQDGNAGIGDASSNVFHMVRQQYKRQAERLKRK